TRTREGRRSHAASSGRGRAITSRVFSGRYLLTVRRFLKAPQGRGSATHRDAALWRPPPCSESVNTSAGHFRECGPQADATVADGGQGFAVRGEGDAVNVAGTAPQREQLLRRGDVPQPGSGIQAAARQDAAVRRELQRDHCPLMADQDGLLPPF